MRCWKATRPRARSCWKASDPVVPRRAHNAYAVIRRVGGYTVPGYAPYGDRAVREAPVHGCSRASSLLRRATPAFAVFCRSELAREPRPAQSLALAPASIRQSFSVASSIAKLGFSRLRSGTPQIRRATPAFAVICRSELARETRPAQSLALAPASIRQSFSVASSIAKLGFSRLRSGTTQSCLSRVALSCCMPVQPCNWSSLAARIT